MGDPNLWGPLVWEWMLSAAYHFRSVEPRFENDRRAYLETFCEMITCLEYILPCKHCRESFAWIHRQVPVAQCLMAGMGAVDPVDWVFEVHDIINIKLEKPRFPRRSLERKLGLLTFNSALCAEMVFIFSLWSDRFCATPAKRKALRDWFQCVLRLARADPYLKPFSDPFPDDFDLFTGRYVARDYLAAIMNEGRPGGPTRIDYEARLNCIFS